MCRREHQLQHDPEKHLLVCMSLKWQKSAFHSYQGHAAMQVVDVNRSNKGTRSGGIGRFSTMVVVGNYKVGQSAALRIPC